ncbi:MAG TPA: glycosyltransferase family 1 protein [Chloroflexota bacterium]|nr:glycosyltransferase family 1 protein [Chloroflexota bacterium]
MHVGINAQLISLAGSYRNAGVSQYIYQVLTHLCPTPPVERVTAFVGPAARPATLPVHGGVALHPSGLPTERPAVRIIWEQVLQPPLLAAKGIDLLHSPVNVLPLLLPTPAVLTIHDLSFLRFPATFSPAKRRYQAAMTSFSARRARLVLTDSEHTRRDVVRLLGVPPGRVRTVYPGVTERYRPAAPEAVESFRRRHGLPERYFVHVGTLQPRKNLERLISAFARFKRASGLPHALLLVGGKGWLYEGLVQRARREAVEGSVHFVGFAAPEDVPLWYAAAEAMVFPSLYEGFGFPIVEAMACGTPVLSSTASCLPEAAGQAAELFDPFDGEALAQAMLRIAADPARRQELRLLGFAQAAQFTWERTAQAVLSAYGDAGRIV